MAHGGSRARGAGRRAVGVARSPAPTSSRAPTSGSTSPGCYRRTRCPALPTGSPTKRASTSTAASSRAQTASHTSASGRRRSNAKLPPSALATSAATYKSGRGNGGRQKGRRMLAHPRMQAYQGMRHPRSSGMRTARWIWTRRKCTLAIPTLSLRLRRCAPCRRALRCVTTRQWPHCWQAAGTTSQSVVVNMTRCCPCRR
mmetsp:Transcript_23748/g.72592  ORF Transcript_23748/g.72592 Transcript_23748/m.72592 type:complete len:200 (+) Transcript_23748:254-853(+)